MEITVIYHTDFKNEALLLKKDLRERWSDASVNMIGILDHLSGAKYQIQLGQSIVTKSATPIDNTTVINLIEERL
tara:strand:+ start:157 stop:381 length:225 start_codon:yes stop_codon:yes gene_type:complete